MIKRNNFPFIHTSDPIISRLRRTQTPSERQMLFIKGEKKRVHFINLKETKGEKNCSKAQMLIDFASQKKSVRCIEKTSAGVGKFCEWHSRYNFLLDERVCSSRELLHVMQIASNLFRNNFWGKRKKIEQRRNNKSEDVFTDNLKRVCNH